MVEEKQCAKSGGRSPGTVVDEGPAQSQPVRNAGLRDMVESEPAECGPACSHLKHGVNSSS